MTELRALVVDYGGVLTNPTGEMFAEWAAANGVAWSDFQDVMREWLVGDPVDSPVHRLETGELTVGDFEQILADRLPTADGPPLVGAGLLHRLMSNFRYESQMTAAVREAHRRGYRTALLSNSWGLDYPRAGWEEMFDVVVISGEVGLRKPDPRIYQLVLDRLGLTAQQCVFVDDLRPNIRAAAELGMVAVHHTDTEATLDELTILLGTDLRDTLPAAAPEGR